MDVLINNDLFKDDDIKLEILKVGQEHCSPRKKTETCKRPCYALHFVLFGRGELIDSNGKSYQINKNEAFLLYENEQYSYCPDLRDPWSYIWVELTGSGLDKLFTACGFDKENVCKHVTDFAVFVEFMKNMYDSYDASQVQRLSCSAYFMLICAKFIEQEQQKRVSPRVAQKKRLLRNILIYINNNYAFTGLSNDLIAQTNGLSVRSLTMLFDELMGMSPVEYINAYRISVACERLQVANLSILDASHWAGFDDEKYFSRVFKKIKGITPQEYQKIHSTEDPFAWIKEKGMLFR